MNPSYFLLLNTQEDESSRELVLSAEVSEWLFSIRFWDEFNQEFGTLFAQYEEEVLPVSLTDEMLEKLKSLVAGLRKQSGQKIRFRYGWNEKKEELYCEVANNGLADELSKLILFFEKISALNSDIYCQL